MSNRFKFLAVIFLLYLSFNSALGQETQTELSPPKRETRVRPEETAFVPNENDIKSFVYRWFSWLDHRVEGFLFLYHLNKEDLLMKLPEATIHSHDDFKKWYQSFCENSQSNTHEVSNIKVKSLANGRYSVDLSVLRRSKTPQGRTLDEKERQNWELSVSAAGRLTINRYIIKK